MLRTDSSLNGNMADWVWVKGGLLLYVVYGESGINIQIHFPHIKISSKQDCDEICMDNLEFYQPTKRCF